MWNSGSNDDPGWPTLNTDGYDPFRESRKNVLIFAHRQRQEDGKTRAPWAAWGGEEPWRDLGLGVRAILLLGGSALIGRRGVLAGHGIQAALLLGLGLCWLCRRLKKRGGHLLVLLLLGILMTGCTDVVRTVAHIHGYQGDPYAQTCAPESLKAGTCVQGGK